MSKTFWLGRFFIEVQASRELYWTDRLQGGRYYHLFTLGIYDMKHIKKGCYALSITALFFGVKFGIVSRHHFDATK